MQGNECDGSNCPGLQFCGTGDAAAKKAAGAKDYGNDPGMDELLINTRGKTDFVDITSMVEEIVHLKNIQSGICHVFVPHTTAGITINENADPDVKNDMIAHLEKMVPDDGSFRHREGNSPAHIKASLVGFSTNVPINEGKLALGTWQGIYLCEFDGPRTRKVNILITQ